eukprot:12927809-Prorocentrum_lima.AAC.1
MLRDLIEQREILPYTELYAMQGFPVVGHFASYCPWSPESTRGPMFVLSDNQHRQLTGNGMHIAQ